ncbi:MAG: transposase, partial [Casimicrobiaceae bacterium]
MHPRAAPPLALSSTERTLILDTLNSPRFADATPYTAWARLLDEGTYLASVRTFYRVLAASSLVRERRDQLVHPAHTKPELIASGPNQVWSWDITRLRSSLKWQFFYLYVLLDIYSRYVVGWLLADAENAGLASALIDDTCTKHGIDRGQLTLHSDRGSPMRAKTTAELLVDLG